MDDGFSSTGHYASADGKRRRLCGTPVVDTETHVFVRVWPAGTSDQVSLVDPFTRTEHSGDLLVAEMDRVGVDVAILIGYDGYDFVDFMHRFHSDPGDFMGGRGYTRECAGRHPDRLKYVPTLRDPKGWEHLALLERELEDGAAGVKIFPGYLNLSPAAPEIVAVFDLLRAFSACAVFGHEDSIAPKTISVLEAYAGLATVAGAYPDVPIQLNHGGNALPGTPEMAALAELAASSPNVLVSTSVLGGVLMDWADEWRYPFDTYRRHLAAFVEAMPREQLAWATDWPWFEGVVKYPQLLQAIVDHTDFFDDAARRAFLGGNAVRHWRLDDPAQSPT